MVKWISRIMVRNRGRTMPVDTAIARGRRETRYVIFARDHRPFSNCCPPGLNPLRLEPGELVDGPFIAVDAPKSRQSLKNFRDYRAVW